MDYADLFAEFENAPHVADYLPITTPVHVEPVAELLLINTTVCQTCNVTLDDDDVCPQCGLGRITLNDTANYMTYTKMPTLGKPTETLIAVGDKTRELGIPDSIVKKVIDKCVRLGDRSTNLRAQIAIGIICAMYKNRTYVDSTRLINTIKARAAYSMTINTMYIYNPLTCIDRQRHHNAIFPELLADHIMANLSEASLTANVNIPPKIKGPRPVLHTYPPAYTNRAKLLWEMVLWFFYGFKLARIGQTRKTRTQICALFHHIGLCLFGVDTKPRRFVKITDITINAYVANIHAYVDIYWPFAMAEFGVGRQLSRNVRFVPLG